MTSETMRCQCGTERRIQRAYTVAEARDRSGFHPVFLVDGGLEYVCPACTEKMRQASALLRSIFGSKLQDVHMLSVSELTKLPDE